MPSSEEALKSENADDVKKCRASIKTQLKVDIKAIQAKLDNKEENGNYKFASISNEMMSHNEKRLQNHYSLFLKLHDHYSEVRDRGSTEKDEENLAEADEEYLQEILNLVCPVLDELKIHKEAVMREKKSKSLSMNVEELNNNLKKAREREQRKQLWWSSKGL